MLFNHLNHRWLLGTLTLLFLCISLAADAQGGAELYSGEVAVASKSESDRSAALNQALRQVIGKLTGLANPQSAVIDEAAANAQNYLQQFQYRGQQIEGGLTFWARFNTQAMDAIVLQSGLPEWSRQRPPVLTWIALRGVEGVELFNLEDPGGLAQAIRRSAWQRGLPLEFPLLDLEDQIKVSAENVWSLDTSKLLEASQRYGAKRIFIARIDQSLSELWTAQWTLLSERDVQNWSSQGTSMEAVVSFGINTAADRIAQSEVLTSRQGGEVPVQVSITGIRNLNDYARTLNYLQSFEQVTGLALREVRSDELSAQVTVRGGADALMQLISFGQVLKPQVSASADNLVLHFSLLP